MINKLGCLIIHGFGGNIDEINPLKQYLNSQGFITICPELKGHTGIRSDLGKYHYTDWIRSAEDGLYKLQNQCRQVIIIGFSMGGLIAVNLAIKHGIDALVLLNMPVYHWDFKRIAKNIADDFRLRRLTHLKKYVKESINKPINSLVNFKVLLAKTIPLLRDVRQPIFVAQALKDATVQHRSADYICKHVASKQRQIKYYKDADHLICCSNAAKELFDDINQFINNTLTEAK